MEYSLLNTVILILSFRTVSTFHDSDELAAVSEEYIAEALYRRVRNENNPSTDEVPEDLLPDEKKRICRSITTSDYFSEVLHEKWVDMDERSYDLSIKEPDIFRSLYAPSPTPGVFLYVNPTRPVTVYVTEEKDEVFQDSVFTCLTIDDQDGKEMYFIYFVSRSYNLGEPSDSVAVGRFLFSYFNHDLDVKVFALAEKPARTMTLLSNDPAVFSFWYREIMNRTREDQVNDDIICKLRPEQRLRLWTLVLSTNYFMGKLKFAPNFQSIELFTCTKMEVTVADQTDAVPNEHQTNKHHKEWVIGCRVKPNLDENPHSEYFLSLSTFHRSDFYLYHKAHSANAIVIENIFREVRFEILLFQNSTTETKKAFDILKKI